MERRPSQAVHSPLAWWVRRGIWQVADRQRQNPALSQAPPAENQAYKKNQPTRKPGQAPHRAAGTFPGVTTTYEPGYEKPSASPRESYWTY